MSVEYSSTMSAESAVAARDAHVVLELVCLLLKESARYDYACTVVDTPHDGGVDCALAAIACVCDLYVSTAQAVVEPLLSHILRRTQPRVWLCMSILLRSRLRNHRFTCSKPRHLLTEIVDTAVDICEECYNCGPKEAPNEPVEIYNI
jgi:hypothetical protein